MTFHALLKFSTKIVVDVLMICDYTFIFDKIDLHGLINDFMKKNWQKFD